MNSLQLVFSLWWQLADGLVQLIVSRSRDRAFGTISARVHACSAFQGGKGRTVPHLGAQKDVEASADLA